MCQLMQLSLLSQHKKYFYDLKIEDIVHNKDPISALFCASLCDF